MVYGMTVKAWAFIRSRLRGVSPTTAADASEPASCPTGSEAPFDHWSSMLLWDKCMIVVTEEGIFERAGTGRWLLHRGHGWITFGSELHDLVLFLERETFTTYKQRIQEQHQ